MLYVHCSRRALWAIQNQSASFLLKRAKRVGADDNRAERGTKLKMKCNANTDALEAVIS